MSDPHEISPVDLTAADDALDELLGSACWPAAAPHQLRHLRRRWLYQSRVPRIARLALAAAAMLAATGLAVWQYRWSKVNVRPDAGPVVHVAEKHVPQVGGSVEVVPEPEPEKLVDGSPRSASESPIIETASTFEFVMAQSARRRRIESKDGRAGAEFQALIEKAVDDLVAGERTLDELQAELSPQAARCEPVLISLIQQSADAKRLTCVQLLAAIATPRSLPTLLMLAESAELRGEAIRGVIRLAPPHVLARLAVKESDHELQSQFMVALIERNSRESVDLFLNLAASARTSEQAFAALSGVTSAPVDLLIDSLQAPKVSRRLVAARVIGQLDDPRATQRLIAMAVQGQSRREALVALLSSSNPAARQFVASGRHDLVWSAQLKAAGSYAQLPTTQFQEI